jgi:hypothetical protein
VDDTAVSVLGLSSVRVRLTQSKANGRDYLMLLILNAKSIENQGERGSDA